MQSTKSQNNNKEEQQYLDLITDILFNGSLDEGRNGKVLSLFGKTMRFSLENNTIPILTSKKVAWKTCLKELLWFVRGHTDNKILQDQNVKIWNDNASREFLDSRNLHNLQINDLGPIYGHQWRHFNADYKDCNTDYTDKGVDQLQYIIDNLKDENTRYSRRLVMSAWNPCQLDEMALPPCHILVQFNVSYGNKLSCALYQRSGDMGLGVPFNIASYAFLTHMIAKHCNLEPYEFIHNLGNAHIYKEHIEALTEQRNRKTYSFPKINIKKIHSNFNDYIVDDFEITDYKYNGPVEMKMIA
jgi:thymidylate synthase